MIGGVLLCLLVGWLVPAAILLAIALKAGAIEAGFVWPAIATILLWPFVLASMLIEAHDIKGGGL
jgi:hypothetical protein